MKLVRKHDKHLEKGDFSLSNLNNAAVWGSPIDSSRLNIDCLTMDALKVGKLNIRGETCFVHLDRKAAFEAYFDDGTDTLISNSDTVKQPCSDVKLEVERDGGCDMWRVRSEFYAALLRNLLQICPTQDNTRFIGRFKHVPSCLFERK
jgi:hypothetical protein